MFVFLSLKGECGLIVGVDFLSPLLSLSPFILAWTAVGLKGGGKIIKVIGIERAGNQWL